MHNSKIIANFAAQFDNLCPRSRTSECGLDGKTKLYRHKILKRLLIQGAIQSTTLFNSHSWDNAKRSRASVSFLHMDVKGVVARIAQAEQLAL